MHSRELLNAFLIVFLCFTVGLVAVRPPETGIMSSTAHSVEVLQKISNSSQEYVPHDTAIDRKRILQHAPAQTTLLQQRQVGRGAQGFHLGSSLPSVAPSGAISPGAPPPAVWDEQLGLSFTQDFTSLAYNVTAVDQADVHGYGPAYLLNGLSGNGYWYQVGLSWDWPFLNGGYDSGFHLNYEVFDSSGTSIFPSSGGGLDDFSTFVHHGDTVLLSLHFSGGNVIMYGYDYNSGASAQESYSAEGATYFRGTPHDMSNRNGFFTGLMTEWYHVSEYYGNEAPVHYSDSTFALSSAWMWMDEYNPDDGTTLFVASNLVSYSDPTQLQYFSSNGATVASDAYDFITGTANLVPTILSYSVMGGGTGYGPPTLTYFSGGVQYVATLTESPTTYYVDPSSVWNASNPLSGSSSTEIWSSNQQTGNVANSSQAINIVYFHQYLVNLDYNVSGTGVGYSPPNVAIEQFGAVNAVTTPSSVFVDAGSQCLYPNLLLGSDSTMMWDNPSTTVTVSSPTTIIQTYYLQYNFTASYSISGGSGYSAPFLHGTQFGSVYAPTLTTTPTTYWLDSGTPWSVDGTLLGSGNSERWITPATTTSGTVSFSITLSPTYYHQYSLNVHDSTVGSASDYSFPELSFTCNGSAQFLALSQNIQTTWADNGTSWSISPNPLAGSNSSVRWDSESALSGTVEGAVTIDPTFYLQYASQVAYELVNGSSPIAPTLAYTQYGGTQQLILTTSLQQIWADSGSSWSASTVAGSSSSERWQAQTASGTLSASTNVIISYYDQWNLRISYTLVGGGDAVAPVFNYTQYGVSGQTYTMTQEVSSIWLDAGTFWSAGPNLLTTSSSGERWDTQSALSGTVSAASTINPVYYHQYLVVYGYSIEGGGNPAAPALNGTSLGASVHLPFGAASASIWLDAGTNYAFDSLLNSSMAERWITNQTSTIGTMSSPATFAPVYVHQFYVEMRSNAATAGTISPTSYWSDAGQQIRISAVANSGWQFEIWNGSGTGSYSGALNSIIVTINSPTVEYATFYVGLTLNSRGYGAVTYSYGSGFGSVPSGPPRVLYVPLNTKVSLTANPSFYIFRFKQWSGAANSTAQQTQITLTAPTVLRADFDFDWVNIVVTIAVLAIGMALLAILILRRRGSAHEW
jgi:hypothetical protein